MKYYNIEGIIQSNNNLTLDEVTKIVLETLDNNHCSLGGMLVEVDEDGNVINTKYDNSDIG